MAADIGVKVKIDGYAQFKSEISDITQQQKTLKSEMQAVSSAWDKNTSAEEERRYKADSESADRITETEG